MLGKLLRDARTKARMTQEDVAGRARISREYLSQLERGLYVPTVEVLMRICKALDTRAWKIVRRLEEP